MVIRVTDILIGKRQLDKKKRRIGFGIIITGILTIIFVITTIYGQYTGSYLISVTKEAREKGIAISETILFPKNHDELRLRPKSGIEDIVEENLDIEGAINTDGQFEAINYIAYTFYLKNVGKETVNIDYFLDIKDEELGLGRATHIKIFHFDYDKDTGLFPKISEKTYSKEFTGRDRIANETILNFNPGDIRKFTVFVWLNGPSTDETMLAGTIKIDWVFTISSAEGDWNE